MRLQLGLISCLQWMRFLGQIPEDCQNQQLSYYGIQRALTILQMSHHAIREVCMPRIEGVVCTRSNVGP